VVGQNPVVRGVDSPILARLPAITRISQPHLFHERWARRTLRQHAPGGGVFGKDGQRFMDQAKSRRCSIRLGGLFRQRVQRIGMRTADFGKTPPPKLHVARLCIAFLLIVRLRRCFPWREKKIGASWISRHDCRTRLPGLFGKS